MGKKMVFLSFLLSACAGMPPPPNGELCTIDLPRNQLICCPISEKSAQLNLSDPACRKIPIALADKYVAFSPETWGNVSNYIKQLGALAEQCQNKTKTK